MPISDVSPLPTESLTLGHAANYLLHGARGFTDVHTFLGRLVEQLAADNVPIHRINLTLAAMHPQVAAVSATWRATTRTVQVEPRAWSGLLSPAFKASPIARFYFQSHNVIRRRLCASDCPTDFTIVDELRQQGMTDYLALNLGGGMSQRVNAITITTKQDDGFTDSQLHTLMSLHALLGIVMEAHVDQRIATTLLQTYLGEDAGSRVLAGQIQRGQGESIPAVISFCDLRNFTGLSDRLPREALLALLDDTFEAVVGAVTDHNGEVLKFIGDAVLAVFRARPGEEHAACVSARLAAESMFARIATTNERRQSFETPPIEVGLSMHVGDVHYGNIGGPTRLDFTVVGPAVNLASRLQGLCGPLERRVIVSEAFARHLPSHTVDLGEHALKGIALPARVFGLDVG